MDPNPHSTAAARQTAEAIEDTIRGNPFETGVLIDPAGNVILQRQGIFDSIDFTVAELRKGAGGIFTHNHPRDSGPSVEDVVLAAQFGIAELRVVTRRHRHAVWQLHSVPVVPLPVEYDDAEQALKLLLRHDVIQNKLHPADFGIEVRHRAWQRVSQKLSFTYRREP